MNPSTKLTDSRNLRLSQLTSLTKNLNGKSVGLDEFPSFVIKNLPADSNKFLLAVYKNSINNGYFPSTRKNYCH